MKRNPSSRFCSRGFTLVELLVVIAIVLVLATLSLVGTTKFIEKGRKVKALAQFRDFQTGLALFEVDYQKPPIPESKQWDGYDTIYGNPEGLYHNGFLVAVLVGESKDFEYTGETFRVDDVNRLKSSYVTFPYKEDKKGGVGPDGNLYDPWGKEIIVAVNGFKGQNFELTDFNDGKSDTRLHTWGLGEYKETKPRDQSYVFWTYGKDGKKGDNGDNPGAVVPYAGSDDVISW
ncbi:MAG: prepilin-type N-terminal cleavage/methylation domain-containing protein [Gloeobacteraceae cyanobacterium ES-bin-144]|nr:prepilin-type N-terminal cleavage/methylation domain-containing protein [Verrucomicrobiales bacterium]